MRRFILITLIPLTGCGFAPIEGSWEASMFDLSQDGCTAASLFGIESADSIIELNAVNTDDGFILNQVDGDSPFTCTLEGKDFTCSFDDVIFDLTNGLGDLPAADAIFTFTGSSSGTFDSKDSGSMSSNITGSCVGEECALVLAGINATNGTNVTDPCESVVTFKLDAVD